ASWFGRKRKLEAVDDAGRDVAEYRQAAWPEAARPIGGGFRRFTKRTVAALSTILLLWGGWVLLGPGASRQSTDPNPPSSTPPRQAGRLWLPRAICPLRWRVCPRLSPFNATIRRRTSVSKSAMPTVRSTLGTKRLCRSRALPCARA